MRLTTALREEGLAGKAGGCDVEVEDEVGETDEEVCALSVGGSDVVGTDETARGRHLVSEKYFFKFSISNLQVG